MPTPPPWWSDTQVAPPAVLSSAFSSGQSETASVPSFIASVSRLGLATEPVSRWSRPMTIGAFSSPARTISLNARPARWRSPRPIQQIRAGRPWNAIRSPAMSSQRCRCGVVREELLHLRVGLADVVGVARQRDPAERPLAAAEQRPDVRRHEAREGERVGDAVVERDLADVVAVVDDRDAERLEVEHRLHVRRAALRAPRRAARACCAGLGLRRLPLRDGPAGRQVAVDEVVRRGLVGDEVGRGCRPPARASAARAAARRRCRAGPTETARFAFVWRSMRASASSRSLACSSR